MRSSHLVSSGVQFLFAVFLLLLGGGFIGLHHNTQLRWIIADFFLNSTVSFLLIGGAILAGGVLLLLCFYQIHKGRYYRLTMGEHKAFVDPAVIRSYAELYWKEVLPKGDFQVEAKIRRGDKIELFLEFPPVAEEEQLLLLQRAEKELGMIFEQQLGYKREFFVSVLER